MSITQSLILFSGGIDSLCSAHFMAQRGYQPVGMFIDYGQAAIVQEKAASANLAGQLGLPLKTVMVDANLDFGVGEVPGRNLLFISIACAYGGIQNGLIVIGVHSGTPYFDCSEIFVRELDRIVRQSTNERLTIFAPFLTWTKREIYEYGLAAGLPLESAYSCESGVTAGCGECLSCQDRKVLLSLRQSG